MSLTHTPAHVVARPDRYEDETTGLGYEVYRDAFAEDPRSRLNPEHAALFVFNGPHGEGVTDVPDNVAARAFAHYYETFSTERAFELTRRYLASFHPHKQLAMEATTVRGYSQSDWFEVFAVVAPGYGTPTELINEYRMRAFGDVWVVSPDRGEPLSGIYADSPEGALKVYLEVNGDSAPPADPSNEPQDPARKVAMDQLYPEIQGLDDLTEHIADRAPESATTALAKIAAALGSQREWSGADCLEEIAVYVNSALSDADLPSCSDQDDEELEFWTRANDGIGDWEDKDSLEDEDEDDEV